MKIRIRGNSVRFRLTQSEVKQLCEKGFFMETTSFGENVFGYAVQLSKTEETLSSSYENNRITLSVSEQLAKNWDLDERVGFEHTLTTKNGTKLHLLLEKDFTCLDNTLEDQSDNYPNPKLQH
jgi:hypothetical protein